jgi:hypothetical protein
MPVLKTHDRCDGVCVFRYARDIRVLDERVQRLSNDNSSPQPSTTGMRTGAVRRPRVVLAGFVGDLVLDEGRRGQLEEKVRPARAGRCHPGVGPAGNHRAPRMLFQLAAEGTKGKRHLPA